MKVEKSPDGQMRLMLPIAAVFTIAAAAYYIGYNYSKVESQDQVQQLQHHFALDEVGGLRSDWERENKRVQEQLKDMEDRLENRINRIESRK